MKSKFTLLSLVLLAIVSSVIAVPMNGTYTIGGTTPNFSTIKAAMDTAVARGVDGPVVFNIRPGTYWGQVSVGSIPGVSATNTVTVKSENNDSTSVILADSASLMTGNFVFHVYGTDYLILKNLTLHRVGVVTNCTVINLATNSRYFQLIGCIVKNDYLTGTNFAQALVYWISGSGNDSLITFDRNIFINGSSAIFMTGQNASSNFYKPHITNNQFINQNYRPIELRMCTAPVITNNIITSTSTSGSFGSIYLTRILGDMRISENIMTGIKGGNGIYMDSVIGSVGAPVLIANNFIHTDGTGNTNGMNFLNARRVNIYYNSIHNGSNGVTSSTFRVASSGDTALDFRNNNLVSSGNGLTFYVGAGITSAISNSNYNNLFKDSTGNLAFYDTGYVATLAEWQTASGRDANSVSGDPLFVSPTDLHAGSPAVNNNGVFIASVTTDIDGQTRSNTTPDIGADEFTPLTDNLAAIGFVLPVSGTFGDSTATVSIVIKNLGQDAQTGFSVSAVLTGIVSTTLTQTYTGNLASNAVDTFTFSTTVNTYAGGTLDITAYTSLAGDQYRDNDTIRDSFSFLFADNMTATGFITPSTSSCGDSATTVSMIIKNLGQTSQTGFSVSAVLTGIVSTTLTETYSANLDSNAVDTVTFSTTINTYAGGTLNITAYTSLSGDQDNDNDTIHGSFNFLAPPNTPAVPSPQTVCDNSIMITGTPDTTDILVWYDQPAGGTPLFVGNVFSPAITTDTMFYVAAHTGSGGIGCLRITEIKHADNPSDQIEISNLSGVGFDATGYVVIVSDDYSIINDINTIVWNLGYMDPGSVRFRTDASTDTNYWGSNLLWDPSQNGWAMIIDGNNTVIDFVAWNWDSISIANMAIFYNGDTIRPGSAWSGDGVGICSSNINTVQRIGSTDNDNASDWACDPQNTGSVNPNLSPVFSYCGVSLCASARIPVSVILTAGITPVNLGNDTIISNIDSLLLDAGTGYDTYAWSTGDTTQTIWAYQGTYWVMVTGGASGCSYADTIIINAPVAVNHLGIDDVRIFPNPANDKLIVSATDGIMQNATFRITDIQGRVQHLRTANGNGQIIFNIDNLPNGIYNLQIISGEKSGVKKFTVIR